MLPEKECMDRLLQNSRYVIGMTSVVIKKTHVTGGPAEEFLIDTVHVRLIKVAVGNGCFCQCFGALNQDFLQRKLHLNHLAVLFCRDPHPRVEHTAEITLTACQCCCDVGDSKHPAVLVNHIHSTVQEGMGLIL